MPPVKGDFRPLRQLGSGSFGEVWLAEEWVDGHLWRLVAVKFLHADQEGAAAALFQEVEKLGRLTRKRGIVDVYHFEVEGERPYFTMDYASEGSLAGLLKRERRLPVARAAAIFRQIVEALESLHYKGIIHCDLKPENVLLNDNFEPMLADFGQARLKGKGPPNTGSWFYMAPEQMATDVRDAETSCDIYALGAIFYKMVTGREPRAEARAHESLDSPLGVREKLAAHRTAILAAPQPVGHHDVDDMDRPLRSIIDRCLETDHAKRFGDGHAVLAALDQRDRCLRKRPTIVRGLIGTSALMLVLLFTLVVVVPTILKSFQKTFLNESLHRDSITAHLAADIIEDILQEYRSLAAAWAENEEIRAAFKKRDTTALANHLARLVDQKRAENGAFETFKVKSSSIYDRQGKQIAIVSAGKDRAELVSPKEEHKLILWNWRDWFNGLGQDQHPRPEAYPPIHQPSVSSPYRGTSPLGSTELRPRMLTFSAPIRTSKNEADPIDGVLAVSIALKQLYPWMQDPSLREHGHIAIVDRHGHVVSHPEIEIIDDSQFELAPEVPFPFHDKGVTQLNFSTSKELRLSVPKRHDAYQDLLATGRKLWLKNKGKVKGKNKSRETITLLEEFIDPINKQACLAAFSYLPESSWGVLIQHDRDDALKSFNDLRWNILAIGWASYLIVLAIVSRLWWIIIRRWRREERFANG